MQIKWPFLFLAVCCSVTSVISQHNPFENFEVMTSSTGQQVCAVDPPTSRIPVRKANAVRCASQCAQYECCNVYQYYDDLSECQLYSYVPTNVTINKQCKAFRSEFGKVAAMQTNESNGGAPLPLSVTCWITIMFRMNESFPLHLNWTDYRNAFGDWNNIYYWAGLETIYQITSRGSAIYRLRFELLAANNSKWYYEEYEPFYLDSEVKGYALHVSQSAVGDAGDSLNAVNDTDVRKVNGRQFYSYDRDNAVKCASLFGGGWWFNACAGHSLTASAKSLQSDANFRIFRWNPLNISGTVKDGLGKLMACRMMIRTL